MAVERVGDMSWQDLTRFVEAVIEQRMASPQPRPYRQTGSRSMKEIVDSMRRNLWTPPPGTKSSLEMLREDRDR
jgi:hypothetical protein